jgi:DNA-binding transcriptional ArsR family regulator
MAGERNVSWASNAMTKLNLRRSDSVLPAMPARVEWGEAYEALLALAMFTGDEPEDSYEVGRDWFKQARRRASPRLKEALKQLLDGSGARWFLLLGLVHELGGRRDQAGLLDGVRQQSATEVLLELVGGRLPRLRLETGRRLVGRVVAGDLTAASEMAALTHPRQQVVIERLAALGPDKAKALTLEILERWRDEVFEADREAWVESIRADAEARSQLAARLNPEQLIERVTGGITYQGEAGIDQVLLIPTAASRPWIVICEWDSTKLFCYRAATHPQDDLKERDLAAVYRALSDETRLRILRQLTAGDQRIADLASELGLAKSTIHSHLAILRRSGLVRLTIGAEKLYGLRPAKPNLNELLEDYLSR